MVLSRSPVSLSPLSLSLSLSVSLCLSLSLSLLPLSPSTPSGSAFSPLLSCPAAQVDAQAAITMLGVGYGGGPSITRAYVHAMEQSVKENMDGNCINCMCHPTENLYSYRVTPPRPCAGPEG